MYLLLCMKIRKQYDYNNWDGAYLLSFRFICLLGGAVREDGIIFLVFS